eukprot:COSAG05_NODE_122_length_17611_cov_47.044655_4_plen_169_part_00
MYYRRGSRAQQVLSNVTDEVPQSDTCYVECCVCLEPCDPAGGTIVQWPCGSTLAHCFHRTCVNESTMWRCPVCRGVSSGDLHLLKAPSIIMGLNRWMVARPLVCFWTCSLGQLMWMTLLSHFSCAIRDGCCVGVGPGCFGSVLPISSLVQSGRSVLALRSPSPSTPRT